MDVLRCSLAHRRIVWGVVGRLGSKFATTRDGRTKMFELSSLFSENVVINLSPAFQFRHSKFIA